MTYFTIDGTSRIEAQVRPSCFIKFKVKKKKKNYYQFAFALPPLPLYHVRSPSLSTMVSERRSSSSSLKWLFSKGDRARNVDPDCALLLLAWYATNVERATPRCPIAEMTASRRSSFGTQLTRAQHNGHFGPGVHAITRPFRVTPKRDGFRCAFVQCTAQASKHPAHSACLQRNTLIALSFARARSLRQTGPYRVIIDPFWYTDIFGMYAHGHTWKEMQAHKLAHHFVGVSVVGIIEWSQKSHFTTSVTTFSRAIVVVKAHVSVLYYHGWKVMSGCYSQSALNIVPSFNFALSYFERGATASSFRITRRRKPSE